ncbi:MAG: LysR family transcriptional regulator [Paracoccaceae bacterium]|nr:LysR family transcriptional regulator [Paracoccaceae bacterium]
MLDRINLLFRFAAIAEAGSLRQASQSLNITQPALSRSLATLEAIYGRPLLERHARGVVPTEFGARLLSRVKRLKRDWQMTEDAMVEDRHSIEGVLRLACGPLWDSVILPKVIPTLQAQFPLLTVEMHHYAGPAIKTALIEGQIDVAFGGLSRLESDQNILQQREFTVVHDRLVARSAHPVHKAARDDYSGLLESAWVVYSADPIYEQQIIHTVVERTGYMPEIRVRCASLLATLEVLENGDYLSMLPMGAFGQVRGRDLCIAPLDLGRRSGPTGARYRTGIADYPPFLALMGLCEDFVQHHYA